jgi:uncharacterized protein YdiU (UPF0061 family)
MMLRTSINDWPLVNSFSQLPASFYSRVMPQPLTEPRLLHVNKAFAAELGLGSQAWADPAFLQVFSGSQPLQGNTPLCAVYSGHQFGVWAGQLGDGRAHLLGEVQAPGGRWELQLKGAGLTPYSRMGDGRAVLRSSVREYLASEAMAGLGIPTTRALALVVSNDPVYRETVETAAIVTRAAPSFVRFGSFEHWHGAPGQLRTLADYVIDQFYPECRTSAKSPNDAVLRMLQQVVRRTAELVASWQTVGFCHGVMNTDNMSILGLTLDYGPYGFMDAFQADHVCNHSDSQGRYAWNAQPAVAHWNLYRLASALAGLGIESQQLKEQLETFEPVFLQAYRANMARKLGLAQWRAGDDDLFDGWWGLLHTQKADFTLSFRALSAVPGNVQVLLDQFHDAGPVHAWLDDYLQRVASDAMPEHQRVSQMNASNPVYVLRNYLAEQAIRAAAEGDASEINTLLTLLRDPFTPRPGHQAYEAAPPSWAHRLEVSCSS